MPVRWPGPRAEAQVCQAKELAHYLKGNGELLQGVGRKSGAVTSFVLSVKSGDGDRRRSKTDTDGRCPIPSRPGPLLLLFLAPSLPRRLTISTLYYILIFPGDCLSYCFGELF